jgi:hypothetical protein
MTIHEPRGLTRASVVPKRVEKKVVCDECADEEPAASADDETCAVLLSEIALLLRNGSWVQSLGTVLVHTFLRQRLTLAIWHRLATADGVLQSIIERRDRRARSDCWFTEGRPTVWTLLVVAQRRKECK